ncbi:MAG TPA: hypothetical protein VD932_03995 [Aquabacterium sp.]|nr:hypothetical protein [Aquabacterium sp.]
MSTSLKTETQIFKAPKNWREIRSDEGETLYYERLCRRYWVRFECGEWWAYYSAEAGGFGDGLAIGKFEKPAQALKACRDHMYEHGLDYFVPT